MIFGVIILILVAGIAFYHFTQGFFSAMISAAIAIMASVVAVGYHEPVAEMLFATSIPNYAHALAMAGLFAIVYVFVRMLADRLIPGNIRLPVLVDKIGGGVFGFIAGVMAAGILALAAQMMPLGADIAGYSRFALGDREVSGVKIPGKYSRQDLPITGEMKGDDMHPNSASVLYPIPADGLLLNLVQHLSDGGSLAGERSLESVHPAYQDELFGHRVGPFRGGDTLFTLPNVSGIQVSGIYNAKRFLAHTEDFELQLVRGGRTPVFAASEDMVPVAVRTVIEPVGTTVNLFSPASIRLVVNGKNYHPIGVVQRGELLLTTRLDDILYVDGRKPVDFVFMVDSESMQRKENSDRFVLPTDAFVEARKAARASLADREVGDLPTDSQNVGIVEKDPKTQQ